MFKLKPQNRQDGSFLLVIECGAESSSMSIKVPLGSAWSSILFFFAALEYSYCFSAFWLRPSVEYP